MQATRLGAGDKRAIQGGLSVPQEETAVPQEETEVPQEEQTATVSRSWSAPMVCSRKFEKVLSLV
jgi:hypothetical protein